MAAAYLGLGSNKGERIKFIEDALYEIREIAGTKILEASSVYETEPWGIEDQGDYLNCVIKVTTNLNAEGLLRQIKGIEKKTGRTENRKWAEREIDIDLLFYGDEIVENEFMKVPHPQIENRRFVLVPMNEIAPDFVHPVLKKKVSELLKETTDELKVTKYNTIKPEA